MRYMVALFAKDVTVAATQPVTRPAMIVFPLGSPRASDGMMRTTLFALALSTCGHEPATSPRAAGPCVEYRNATNHARTVRGDVEVELFNGCGCPQVVHTTAVHAAAARDALAHMRAAKTVCWVNCDQPCQPDDSRW